MKACYNDEDRPQTHGLPVDVDDCHSEAAGNWLRAQGARSCMQRDMKSDLDAWAVYFPSCWNGEDLDSVGPFQCVLLFERLKLTLP